MAAPFFSTPFQPYVYQSPQAGVTAFQILGGESQIVQIMLKSQEKLTAKPGTICYMSGSIQVDNNYGNENEAGIWQWFFGKTVASIMLSNTGPDDEFVGIAAPPSTRILPVDLSNFNGEILCQPDSLLCSVNDVRVTSTIDRRIRNIDAGADVVLKQKLVGQGLAFLVAGGSVVQKVLAPDEVLVTDAACIIAMTSTINFQLKYSNPMKRVLFGGDNQLMATLSGPGIVFIQSLPIQQISQRVSRLVGPPGLRENPKLFLQIMVFFVFAYLMIISSLILTDA